MGGGGYIHLLDTYIHTLWTHTYIDPPPEFNFTNHIFQKKKKGKNVVCIYHTKSNLFAVGNKSTKFCTILFIFERTLRKFCFAFFEVLSAGNSLGNCARNANFGKLHFRVCVINFNYMGYWGNVAAQKTSFPFVINNVFSAREHRFKRSCCGMQGTFCQLSTHGLLFTFFSLLSS